jgi:hypothetical protein
MSIARGLMCIGVATGALVGGLALSAAAAGPLLGAAVAGAGALTLQGCMSEALKAIGGGLAGNLTEASIGRLHDTIAVRLGNASRRGRLPENHDLVRALRCSQLDAIRFLVGSYADEQSEAGGDLASLARTFRKMTWKFLDTAEKRVGSDDFFLGEQVNPLEGAAGGTPDVFETAHLQIERLWEQGSSASLAELRDELAKLGAAVPASFGSWYEHHYGPAGFVIVAQQFFAERMKVDERLRTAVFQSQFEAIGSRLDEVLGAVAKIDANARMTVAGLTERFDALEQKIDYLASRTENGVAASPIEAMIRATADAGFRDALEQIAGAYRPHDDWRGSIASKAVSERIDELLGASTTPTCARRAFFGRGDQLDRLDGWLDERDRGLLVLCAPSGGGKSSLLAKWQANRLLAGDHVVRHFVSVHFPITTSPTGTLQHLLAQLREIDRADPKDREAEIPTDETALLDAIHGRLSKPANGKRLVLVLDAMDELDAPIRDCFVRSDLAAGNYVVVSHRAEAATTPAALWKWLTAFAGGGQQATRFDLPPMSSKDIWYWLEARAGAIEGLDFARLSGKLLAATDGVPLFLHHLMATLDDQIAVGMAAADITAFVERLSGSFSSGFLRDHLEGEFRGAQQQLGRPFTQSERAVMAVLTQVRGPISLQELNAVYGTMRSEDPGLESLDAARLDQRLLRWLSSRPADPASPDQADRVSFDHVRLADEFSNALGQDVVQRAKDCLIEWAISAWKPRKSRFSQIETAGAEYSARHAPQHLIEHALAEDSAKLLMDMEFIRARMLAFPVDESVALMQRDWNAWSKIELRQGHA